MEKAPYQNYFNNQIKADESNLTSIQAPLRLDYSSAMDGWEKESAIAAQQVQKFMKSSLDKSISRESTGSMLLQDEHTELQKRIQDSV